MINSFTGRYRFLSNFWPVRIELDRVTYPSVENAYQAAKCKIVEHRFRFVSCSAGQAKRIGNQILIRGDWEQIKHSVMQDLLEKKFSVPLLRSLLLQTEDQELIEGNTWGDTYWGVCRGVGQNHLGKLLMEIRKNLKKPKLGNT